MALTTESALRKDKRNASGKIDGMQHRHFAVIAGIIAQIEDTAERDATAYRFMRALRGTNDRFDEERFLKACGV